MQPQNTQAGVDGNGQEAGQEEEDGHVFVRNMS